MGLTVRFWHCMGNQGMARSRSSAWRPELTRGFLSFLKRKVTQRLIERAPRVMGRDDRGDIRISFEVPKNLG